MSRIVNITVLILLNRKMALYFGTEIRVVHAGFKRAKIHKLVLAPICFPSPRCALFRTYRSVSFRFADTWHGSGVFTEDDRNDLYPSGVFQRTIARVFAGNWSNISHEKLNIMLTEPARSRQWRHSPPHHPRNLWYYISNWRREKRVLVLMGFPKHYYSYLCGREM